MVYIYTAKGGLLVNNAAIQTAVVTCPTAVFSKGTNSWAKLPAVFRGQTINNGYNLLSGAAGGIDAKLSNGNYVAYTKPLGISFKPNVSSQYGNYGNFSVEVAFTFS